jgi:hypothetical protein
MKNQEAVQPTSLQYELKLSSWSRVLLQKDDSRSASQEITSLLWHPEVH